MIAQMLGVTPQALGRWAARREASPAASERRGRPAVIPPDVRERIRARYSERFGQWGPRVLAAWCEREGLGRWSPTTIAAAIADLKPQKPPEPVPVRYEISGANVMWSEDGTGFRQRGRKRELLVVQDDHARLKLNWRLVDGPARSGDVVDYLDQALRKYGPPLVLKHDGDGIFQDRRVQTLLDRYGVVSLTAPPGWPGYNGKQERSMRDIKSYERAMRRCGVRGRLAARLDVAMQDLNEERPRPVLGGRTAREAYEQSNIRRPGHRTFLAEVNRQQRKLETEATSRAQLRSARRRATEQVLMRYGLMKIVGDVSHDLSSDVGTE